MRTFLNVALLGIAVCGFTMMAGQPAPEINPGSAASALVAVAGTLAIIRGRRKKS